MQLRRAVWSFAAYPMHRVDAQARRLAPYGHFKRSTAPPLSSPHHPPPCWRFKMSCCNKALRGLVKIAVKYYTHPRQPPEAEDDAPPPHAHTPSCNTNKFLSPHCASPASSSCRLSPHREGRNPVLEALHCPIKPLQLTENKTHQTILIFNLHSLSKPGPSKHSKHFLCRDECWALLCSPFIII
ncbi:hypothetical protein E2C01_033284 [Portunus trituberculatus]|uniref:Uncharacterized protein n=1 Tax=Portunus trituberculatus TaxID=210409 RepID=A0A5B7F312_PORTR|nr:hypothetical protein [Portunus trituberculatus]